MKQQTLNISANKFNTFLEFVKTLDYVDMPDENQKALNKLQIRLKEVKLMQEVKIEKQSTEDFLNEL